VPTAPGIWNMHLQVHDTLLLVCDSANLRSAYASQAAYYGQQLGGFDSRALGQRGVDFTAGMRVRHLHTRRAEADRLSGHRRPRAPACISSSFSPELDAAHAFWSSIVAHDLQARGDRLGGGCRV
jgi:hypothetical protein